MAGNNNITAFSNVMPYRLVDKSQCFRQTFCLHVHGATNELLHLRCREQIPSKGWYLCIRSYGIQP
jgi:hypothetical protein